MLSCCPSLLLHPRSCCGFLDQIETKRVPSGSKCDQTGRYDSVPISLCPVGLRSGHVVRATSCCLPKTGFPPAREVSWLLWSPSRPPHFTLPPQPSSVYRCPQLVKSPFSCQLFVFASSFHLFNFHFPDTSPYHDARVPKIRHILLHTTMRAKKSKSGDTWRSKCGERAGGRPRGFYSATCFPCWRAISIRGRRPWRDDPSYRVKFR